MGQKMRVIDQNPPKWSLVKFYHWVKIDRKRYKIYIT